MSSRNRMTLSQRLNQHTQPVDELFQSTKDININNDNDIEKDNKNNIDNDSNINNNNDININKENNINIDKDNDNNKDIDIDTKKDIKKYIKPKKKPPVGYHCRLPEEYIKGIDKAKKMTGFYKDELARMAYDLLFEELGIIIKK